MIATGCPRCGRDWRTIGPAGGRCAVDGFIDREEIDQLRPAGQTANGNSASPGDLFDPTVRAIARGYLVSLPHGGGRVHFRFDGLEQRGRALASDLSVWQDLSGVSRETFTARIDALSLSKRAEFSRQLNLVFNDGGRGGPWPMLLNRACELVRAAMMEADPSVHLQTAPRPIEAPALLAPWVTPDAGMIFGPGGCGKTEMAIRISAAIATGGTFLDRQAREAAVLYLDYESNVTTLQNRLVKILAGMEVDARVPIDYWPARGVPLPDLVPALQRKIAAAGIGFIVIDSAAMAAGADAEKSETATRYFNALAALGVPSLTIAHVTKAGEDQYPFGSIFWHNCARNTWNVKSRQEHGEAAIHAGLFNRKANDGPLHPPVGVTIRFGEDRVAFEPEHLQEEWTGEISLSKRIVGTLEAGKLSVKDLAVELGAKPGVIRARLNEMDAVINLGKSPDGSGLWGLKA